LAVVIPLQKQGYFILKKTMILTLVVPRMPTLFIHDFVVVSKIGAATGGGLYKRIKQPCLERLPKPTVSSRSIQGSIRILFEKVVAHEK
jgi:hypothetical protein